MTVRLVRDPAPFRRRSSTDHGTVELNPHGVTVIGTQPILSMVLDLGDSEPAVIVKLPADLQLYVHRKLGEKLPGAQHD